MRNRLFKNYTMGCRGKTSARMQTTITSLSTDDEIRTYMFREHNQNARQEIHKVKPYHITDQTISKAISPGFLQELKQRGISLPNQLEEYVIFHAGLPVDTMTRAELMKYIHQNENSRLRQSAA